MTIRNYTAENIFFKVKNRVYYKELYYKNYFIVMTLKIYTIKITIQ